MEEKNPITDEYIRQRYGNVPKKNLEDIKIAMDKYGENHWWESKDSRVVAMYQIFEEILLVDFSTFHEGLEKLCDRPIYTHELGLNIEEIRQEARLGIKRLKTGIGISDEAREHYVLKSIQMLEDYCKKTGKQFLKVDLTQQSPEKNKDEIDKSGYDGWLKSE